MSARHERMAVAIAAHPRAEAEHVRNLDAAVGISSSPRALAEFAEHLAAPSPTAPAETTGRGGLRASPSARLGRMKSVCQSLISSPRSCASQLLDFAGQQLVGIEFVHQAADRPQLRAQRFSLGFGRMGREDQLDADAVEQRLRCRRPKTRGGGARRSRRGSIRDRARDTTPLRGGGASAPAADPRPDWPAPETC